MAQGWGLGSLINLDHYGHYIHWGVIQISVGNFTVIVLMVATFLAALFAPCPGRRSRKGAK